LKVSNINRLISAILNQLKRKGGAMTKAKMQTTRELREARGWTQLELGYKLGVMPVTVHNWERGQHMPTASQLRALARAFGVSIDVIDFEGPVEAKSAA
jgi:transcriptional regulator with XRE-family HTH domain